MQRTSSLARADRLLVLVASFTLASCASDNRVCTLAAVSNGASIEFSPPISGAGSWGIELDAQELHCVRFLVLGLAAPADPDAGAQRILPSELVNVPECYDGWPSDGNVSVSVSVSATGYGFPTGAIDTLRLSMSDSDLVDELTYRAYQGTELRYERTVRFSYHSNEPNGPGCGHVSTATVKTPP